MATDQTPPRSQLIGMYAVLSALVLFSLKFVFDWYFLDVTERQMQEKVLSQPAQELKALRSEEEKIMRAGKVSIRTAMRMMAHKGRMEADPMVAPVASDDMRAMTGWTHFKDGQVPASAVPMPKAGEESVETELETGDEESAETPAVEAEPKQAAGVAIKTAKPSNTPVAKKTGPSPATAVKKTTSKETQAVKPKAVPTPPEPKAEPKPVPKAAPVPVKEEAVQ